MNKLVYLVDDIINELNQNKILLNFIAKSLSWGVFKSALDGRDPMKDSRFYDIYLEMLKEAPHPNEEPEIMLFTIIELVSSACCSCILHNEPMPLKKYIPYLNRTIRTMIHNHEPDRADILA